MSTIAEAEAEAVSGSPEPDLCTLQLAPRGRVSHLSESLLSSFRKGSYRCGLQADACQPSARRRNAAICSRVTS